MLKYDTFIFPQIKQLKKKTVYGINKSHMYIKKYKRKKRIQFTFVCF